MKPLPLWILAVSFAAFGCGGSGATTTTDTAVANDSQTTADTGIDAPAPVDVADAAGPGGTDSDAKTPASFDPAVIKIMSFNIACVFCSTPGELDPWMVRMPYLRDVITRHNPDLMGIQELNAPELTTSIEPNQKVPDWEFLIEGIPDYAPVYWQATSTDDCDPDTELCWSTYPDATVYYRTSRFSLLDKGAFWLSLTPDEPYTSGFTGKTQFFRIVIWVLLEEKATGKRYHFVSTHFDNNKPSQELSAPLMLERMAKLAAKHPVLITGDYNSDPSTKAYEILTKGVSLDGKGFALTDTFVQKKALEIVTNQKSAPTYDDAKRIDYVFYAGGTFGVDSYIVDLTTYGANGYYPSDHRAILAVVRP